MVCPNTVTITGRFGLGGGGAGVIALIVEIDNINIRSVIFNFFSPLHVTSVPSEQTQHILTLDLPCKIF